MLAYWIMLTLCDIGSTFFRHIWKMGRLLLSVYEGWTFTCTKCTNAPPVRPCKQRIETARYRMTETAGGIKWNNTTCVSHNKYGISVPYLSGASEKLRRIFWKREKSTFNPPTHSNTIRDTRRTRHPDTNRVLFAQYGAKRNAGIYLWRNQPASPQTNGPTL